MSLEENKAIIRRMVEAINTQNLALLDELMAPDFVLHMHGQQIQGWEVLNKQVTEDEIKSFPNSHVTIADIFAEGDKVCVRMTEKATYKREYSGLTPTGNKLPYTVIAIWRVVDDKIVEGWVVYN